MMWERWYEQVYQRLDSLTRHNGIRTDLPIMGERMTEMYETRVELSNPACAKAGSCQDFCGLCVSRYDERGRLMPRRITSRSLYHECRLQGYCSCGLCAQSLPPDRKPPQLVRRGDVVKRLTTDELRRLNNEGEIPGRFQEYRALFAWRIETKTQLWGEQ